MVGCHEMGEWEEVRLGSWRMLGFVDVSLIEGLV
jgi:hypothetical protein